MLTAKIAESINPIDHILIIRSLILRNLKLRYLDRPLGVLQELIKPTFFCVLHYYVFWALGRQFAAGISIEEFVWAGFTVWLLYSQVMVGARVWRASRPLPFPGVTAMHMRIANVVWVVVVYAVFLYVSVGLLILFGDGNDVSFPNVMLTALIILLAAMLGLGFGLLLAGLSRVLPVLDPFLHLLGFLVFLSSGLYYSSATTPPALAAIFLYNPMLHLIEYERYAFDPGYPIYLVSLWYPAVFATGLLLFGLVVTRRLRYTVTA